MALTDKLGPNGTSRQSIVAHGTDSVVRLRVTVGTSSAPQSSRRSKSRRFKSGVSKYGSPLRMPHWHPASKIESRNHTGATGMNHMHGSHCWIG